MLAHALQRLREEPRPLRFIASRLLWRSGTCRLLGIARDGYRLRFYPTALSATLWLDPHDRAEDEAILRAVLGPGDRYVDVGANIGHLALCAASIVGPRGAVVAFEAHPRTFGFLARNAQANRFAWVRCVHSALGEKAGTLQFSNLRSDDQNGVVEVGGDTVAVAPLDQFALGSIALLKIDVEGFEGPVLQGARQTLASTAAVLFESWETHLAKFGWDTPMLLREFDNAGFRVFEAEAGALRPVAATHRSLHCENLLALRDPAAFCLRSGWRMAKPD